MTVPIEISLPNGLIISMMPYESNSPRFTVPGVSKASTSTGETQDQLWQRFINALSSTDLASLRKVYESAMPVPRNAPREAFPARPLPTVVETPKK